MIKINNNNIKIYLGQYKNCVLRDALLQLIDREPVIIPSVFSTVKPRLMATLVIQSPCYYGQHFWPPGKSHHTFSCKKTLVNRSPR